MTEKRLSEAEKYLKNQRGRKLWYRIVTCLAAVVVFCTAYALILPAVTLEKTCEISVHTHSNACYSQITSIKKKIPTCSVEGEVAHQHDSYCYDEDGTFWCTLAELEGHVHAESCYVNESSATDQNTTADANLMVEETAHEHTEACWIEHEKLICEVQTLQTMAENATDSNAMEMHVHTEDCYEKTRELVCGYDGGEDAGNNVADNDAAKADREVFCGFEELPAHQHTDACFEIIEVPVDTTALTCENTEPEHEHTKYCYGIWELTCGMEEHVHSSVCMPNMLSEEEQARVDAVIEGIAGLPTSEEIEEKLAFYEEAGDMERYEECFQKLSIEVRTVYAYYEDLGSELQEYVTNSEKLMALEWIWVAETLEIQDTLKIYQINTYSQAVTTLVYGGSVREKLGAGMGFTYWDAIIVEKNESGLLYVSQYKKEDESKLDYKASTADGFVLLLYDTKTTIDVGHVVTVGFDYKTSGAYNSGGYGSVFFDSNVTGPKKEKDNTDKLTVVPSADTRNLIEINLYDYGDHINDLYKKNKNYPGFQQDNGVQGIGTDLNLYSFNFGNNITSDLAAGNTGVTNKGGDINTTVNGANSPISGVMSPSLKDGYPALADGTSLAYLFSDNTYTKKMNKQSINGLFKKNDTTGAYTFNSRENHAQFNSSDDTFDLYDQIITSNFMMYPFGNFLPFNDIVHLSAQASTIDRAYLQTIADSAGYKSSGGDEYGTLKTLLEKFIKLMDDACSGTEWGSVQCLNKYFESAGIPLPTTGMDDQLKKLYSIDYDEPTDFYFGMEMKMNFMQPKDGLTGNDGKQPMVFYFTGDDDVWIYVDNVLFLDLSGIHRHVGGEIDFVNGLVKYYDLDVSTGDVSTAANQTKTFAEILGSSDGLEENGRFKDYSQHSFNFYYMERGAGSGVCRMNFNFPLLQRNSISVSKRLSADSEIGELLGNPDFKFQVLREDGKTLFIDANAAYKIQDLSGNEIGSGTTDANGVFTLKANQTAIFSNIPENAGQYFVRELLDPAVFEQYGTISVNGSSRTENYEITVGSDTFKGVNSPLKDVSDGSTAFEFNNQVTTSKLGSLSILKTMTEYPKAKTVGTFSFEVTLDGNSLPVGTKYHVLKESEGKWEKIAEREVNVVTEDGQSSSFIELSPGEKAVINNILAGTTFYVKETEASSSGYEIQYRVNDGEFSNVDGVSGIIPMASEVSVTVNNSELGTSVSIPVQKILQAPDGETHTYAISLEQVKDSSGASMQEEQNPVCLTKEVTFSGADSSKDVVFEVGYPQTSIPDSPQKFYYKIVEHENAEDIDTIYDSSKYIVEVTVSKSESDSGASAVITNVWKNGTLLSVIDGSTWLISFTNQIVRYELPQTGGIGTNRFTIGGICMVLLAVILLLYRRKLSKY